MATPLHIDISETLRHQIDSGKYQPGEKLPSEHQIMEIFGVSRITARQAVANLISQGLVRSQQGKGVFVTQQVKTAYSLSSPIVFLAQDFAGKGVTLSFESLSFKKVRPSQTVQAALQLAAGRGEENPKKENSKKENSKKENPKKAAQTPAVYFQKKLLHMDGAVGAIDISYLLLELGQSLGPELKKQMTFPVLEANGFPIEKIEAVIECTQADYEISNHLEVPLGHPLIVYKYTAYTKHQVPLLYGETISRADRFCYSLTIE
ncbi:MAG: GntR family transcriptional regulator [Cyanobacteria bacterium P01_D01_bin.105]